MNRRGVRMFPRLLLATPLVVGALAQVGPASAIATIVPNVFTDDNANNDNCTLREAILTANTGAVEDDCTQGTPTAEDIIELPPGTYTLDETGTDDTGAAGDLDITDDLILRSQGGSAQDTIVLGGSIGGPGGNGVGRVFDIQGMTEVTISTITVANGQEDPDGFAASGIRTAGVTTLDRVVVRDNYGSSGVGAGGANGDFTMTNSAIVNNIAIDVDGGGLRLTFGPAVLRNSTISGNTTDREGGGISQSADSLTLDGVTIADNHANTDGLGSESGGGIFANPGELDPVITGSVIADNTVGTGGSGPDCSASIDSGGANVIEDASGCTDVNGPGDLTGTDPQLQPLSVNPPGTTPTHALPDTSVAVDLWPTASCSSALSPAEDQRGVTRPQGPACDSGAFEIQVETPTVPVVCKGKTATITGTEGADTIPGTSGADVIAALGGNDTVKGLGKNDLVCGGDGNDKLRGGGGKDKLLGENGNDNLKGGGGDKDKTIGGKGNDKCSGGGGEKDKARKCETVKAVP